MKRHLGGFGLVTLMIVVLAVPAGAQVVFTDVTEEVGIALTDQLIESVAWGDYDDDGDQDLYLTGDGPNHRREFPGWSGRALPQRRTNRC
jgi:hypothetical protein